MASSKLTLFLIRTLSSLSPKTATSLAVKLFLSPQRYPRTNEEELFWKTGRAVMFASGAKGRIFGESKKIIWIVHGWESRASKMRVIIEACVKAGFQVIAWDMPAHGDSPGNRTNMALVANALLQDAAARTDETIYAVIGHSFGANAVAYACRLGLKTEKLILISAPSSVRHVFVRFWQAIQLADPLKPPFIEQVEKETGVTISDVSVENFIGKLSQKIQIIHDRSDKEIPFAEAEELKVRNPNASLVSTEKLGHRRILESQVVANLVLKFLV